MSATTATQHAPLEYAPGAPVRRRRRIKRVVQLFALLGVGLAAWRWGPAARDQATLLYWQRECLRFEFPADVVLYERDPARAAALLRAQDPQYVALAYYGHGQPMVTHAVYQPRALREFATRSSATTPAQRSIVFCHDRRTPAGKRRLVIVYTSPWNDFGPLWEWALFEPAGLASPPRPLSAGGHQFGYSNSSGFYVPRRLGPGHADPADPTHFTFPCLVNGQPSATYDGRLTDDDKVVITERR
jgi:hypothetical protein